MKIYRHTIDVFSTVFVVQYVAFQVAAIITDLPWWVCIPFLALLLRPVCLIQHNHVHLSVFHGKMLNELFSLACFFACGVPSDGYIVHHVIGHHHGNNEPGKDPSSIFDFSGAWYPNMPVGIARYVISFPFRAAVWSAWYLMHRAPRTMRRRFLRSLVIVGALVGWFLFRHPVETAIVVFVPWVLTWFSLGRNNYRHHAGCDMDGPYRSANNNLTRIGMGSMGFGIGFHTAHHLHPALHWSRLWLAHARIHERIPSSYIQMEPHK